MRNFRTRREESVTRATQGSRGATTRRLCEKGGKGKGKRSPEGLNYPQKTVENVIKNGWTGQLKGPKGGGGAGPNAGADERALGTLPSTNIVKAERKTIMGIDSGRQEGRGAGKKKKILLCGFGLGGECS